MSCSDTIENTYPGAPHSNGLFNRLRSFYKNWQARRQVVAMMDFDDRMLKDIGLTHDDVVWASRLPLDVNSAHQINQIYRARRGNGGPSGSSLL